MERSTSLSLIILTIAAFFAGYFLAPPPQPLNNSSSNDVSINKGQQSTSSTAATTDSAIEPTDVKIDSKNTQTKIKPIDNTPKPPSLIRCEPIEFKDDLTEKDLKTAIKHSLKYYEGVPQHRKIMYGKEAISKKQITDTLEDVLASLNKLGLTSKFYAHINKNFTWYKTSADTVLFTGYYLAALNGSRKKTNKYKYPLYKNPDDLCLIYLKQFSFYKRLKEENPGLKGLPGVIKGRLTNKTIVPYYTKHEIDYENKLKGKGLEFVWVDSPVDRFFLQVQGSGIVQFEDGTNMRVNYAQSNGQTYKSIGKMLIKKGILTEENVSMKTIRAHLHENPDQVKPVLTHDPSYVFFRTVKGGPYGCFGVPVTQYRSIATDRKCFPAAGIAIIKTEKPVFNKDGEITKWETFTRFVLNHDTGGAIKSPARVDLYCGFGELNEKTAGHMKQDGTIYFMLKKQ